MQGTRRSRSCVPSILLVSMRIPGSWRHSKFVRAIAAGWHGSTAGYTIDRCMPMLTAVIDDPGVRTGPFLEPQHDGTHTTLLERRMQQHISSFTRNGIPEWSSMTKVIEGLFGPPFQPSFKPSSRPLPRFGLILLTSHLDHLRTPSSPRSE